MLRIFSVVGTVVALSFAPVVRWAQRLVDGLFYGDRSDPYRTLRELGRRLHMRRIPHIKFILDRSIAEGDRIAAILREVAASTPLHDEGTDPV